MKTIQLFLIMLVISHLAYANDCDSVEEMDKADNAASAIHGWQGVYSFYENYRQCDEGYIAEGMSATIVGLLANNWKTSHQLMHLSESDRAFESWMINHINTTTNDRDLDKVVRNAADNCPEGDKAFCNQIENAAQGALKELQSQ
ncbi:MAG: hypothetical protein E6127_11540 [Enterobacter sichuanensis]|uniref:Uncharacterized protein n=1 Tax=Enterobacter cloacae TaxID=550 RepID=A0AB37VG27_ENTCL|nr:MULTISPECIES: hypothetical protein [Enterobacter cloacae complex]MBY6355278.1 hypothetical protein [Enterobacter sichuanensis]MDU5194562.1 hypothetical protein [Enterobacter sichuanensis]MDU5347397.1 hypothetical protein [Enterobacter sichuanensis]MDU5386729.1 hypothetical protein [Enterobacter sichuanensis]RWT76398.1 hypothetical protein DN595_17400 [Enterobacter cloacae]